MVLIQANAVSQEAVDNKVDGAGSEVRDAGLCHKCAMWVLDNPEKKRLVLELSFRDVDSTSTLLKKPI